MPEHDMSLVKTGRKKDKKRKNQPISTDNKPLDDLLDDEKGYDEFDEEDYKRERKTHRVRRERDDDY